MHLHASTPRMFLETPEEADLEPKAAALETDSGAVLCPRPKG